MDIIEIFKTMLIGIVQGITEWLPISSTGHMILLDEIIKMDITEQFKELFFVIIQLGSIFAVIFIYFHKLNPFSLKKSPKERNETMKIWGKVVVGASPAAIIGVLFDDKIDELFYNYQVVAFTLILYGVLFIFIERRNKTKIPKVKKMSNLTYKTALFIGLFQILALIPGTSRSGATILGAVLIGCTRSIAAEYSFFLAVPIMFGASFLKILKFGFNFTVSEFTILAVGMITAFLISVIAIKFLVSFVKKHDFKVFGYYRIALGIVVLSSFMLLK